jgi:hypothetical protein
MTHSSSVFITMVMNLPMWNLALIKSGSLDKVSATFEIHWEEPSGVG